MNQFRINARLRAAGAQSPETRANHIAVAGGMGSRIRNYQFTKGAVAMDEMRFRLPCIFLDQAHICFIEGIRNVGAFG